MSLAEQLNSAMAPVIAAAQAQDAATAAARQANAVLTAQVGVLQTQVARLATQLSAALHHTDTPPVTPTPAIVGDITAQVTALTDGQTLNLPAGNYTCNKCTVSAKSAKVIGAAVDSVVIQITGTISLSGDGIEVAGMTISSKPGAGWQQVFETCGKNISLHDITADKIGTLVKTNGSTGLVCESITTEMNVGGAVYYLTDSDVTLRNCIVRGLSSPISEQAVRIDINDATGNRPSGIIIDSCHLTNLSASGKEAIAIRESAGVTILNSTIIGYIRAGQEPSTNQHVTNLVIDGCKLPYYRPAFSEIEIKNGVTGIIRNTEFGPYAGRQTKIMVNANSTISLSGNVTHDGDPIFNVSGGVVNDDGTTVVKTASPELAVHPTHPLPVAHAVIPK